MAPTSSGPQFPHTVLEFHEFVLFDRKRSELTVITFIFDSKSEA